MAPVRRRRWAKSLVPFAFAARGAAWANPLSPRAESDYRGLPQVRGRRGALPGRVRLEAGRGGLGDQLQVRRQPDVTGLSVGNIVGIAKKGWEYLWVRYQDAEDAAAKALVKKPVAVYVER